MNGTNRILFQEPDLDKISERYIAVDMHVHTRYSDGASKVCDLAKRASLLNIGLAVTDHNDIRGAVEMDSVDNVFSIPGIEITTEEGSHLLCYFNDIRTLKTFYKEEVLPYLGGDVMLCTSREMEAYIESAGNFDGFVVLPHPYSAAYTGIDNINFPEERKAGIFKMINGVEVINAGNLNRWNLKCALLGFNLNKAVTGGSDAHQTAHLGKAVTYCESEKNPKSFLSAVRGKQNKVMGKEIDFINQVASNSLKLKTGLKNCPDVLEKNVRYSVSLINSKSRKLRENVKRNMFLKLKKAGDIKRLF